jgi:hypothetical protein
MVSVDIIELSAGFATSKFDLELDLLKVIQATSSENAMCYGNPAGLLANTLESRSLTTNAVDHNVIEDFEHFCVYSGCDPTNAWAKLAFVSARLPEAVNDPAH